ncbi:MAG TPA: hypothetical protein VE548_15890 [Nitrososphaeraceae archaeon]|jgi:predicted CopG family antitoxin|nr:hypothetical protein [Nitrososphaeraceae archaeon]
MSKLQQVSNDERTTVSLSKENYNKLKQLGFTGESFNTVIGRLIEKVENY